jgi:hypothetical protein
MRKLKHNKKNFHFFYMLVVLSLSNACKYSDSEDFSSYVVNKNINASNGNLISLNENGIWLLKPSEISLLNEDGKILKSFTPSTTPFNNLDIRDSFLGIYTGNKNKIFKIHGDTSNIHLKELIQNNFFQLYVADSNVMSVRYIEKDYSYSYQFAYYQLKFYPNIKYHNNFDLISNQMWQIYDCVTYCEMNKGNVYFISVKYSSNIENIKFNDNQKFYNRQGGIINGYFNLYKLDKLSDKVMVLMTENKMHFYELAPHGLVLKSVI